MTLADLAITLSYASLAGAALAAARRDPDRILIGIMLCTSFAVSNATYHFAPIDARPVIYTLIEVLIATASAIAFMHRPHWPFILVVAAAAVSIVANLLLSSALAHHYLGPLPRADEYQHALVTNICYAAECISLIWMGLSDELRAGRFDRWLGRGDLAARQDAAAQAVADPDQD